MSIVEPRPLSVLHYERDRAQGNVTRFLLRGGLPLWMVVIVKGGALGGVGYAGLLDWLDCRVVALLAMTQTHRCHRYDLAKV